MLLTISKYVLKCKYKGDNNNMNVINVKAFARLTGVHFNTAYSMVKDGRLEAVKVKGVWHIKESEIIRYLSKQAEIIEQKAKQYQEIKEGIRKEW